MSADSLETIVRSCLSHSTGTEIAALVVRIGGVVGLGEELEAVQLVGERAAGEAPAALVAGRVQVGDAERVGQAGELADDHRAVRPGARERDVEVVALRPCTGRHAIAEDRALANELAVRDLSPERE